MCTDDARAGVVDDVGEIVGDEPVIDRDEDGADLRDRVEGLELRMRVGRDVRDAVAGGDAQLLQRRRPFVAALEELRVRQTERAVDDRLALGVQAACATRKLEGREGYFDGGSPSEWSASPASLDRNVAGAEVADCIPLATRQESIGWQQV